MEINNQSTYIGEKGYTIFKECISIDDQHFIRENLTVKPYIPNSIVKAQEFPIYRESQKKFYIPKFFGIEHFGAPETLTITNGDNINIQFKGDLRDYQKPIVDAFINKTKNSWGGGGILDIPCGYGKCLAKDTPIIMYDGSIKFVQDIIVNDQLMGDDSTARKVLSLARGKEALYEIIPKYGDRYIVNESHILSLTCVKGYGDIFIKGKKYDICVKEILKLLNHYNVFEYLHGYRVPIYFKKKEIYVDPYFIGYWLGYTNCSYQICNYSDEEVLNVIDDINNKLFNYNISAFNILEHLKRLNLIKTTYIPLEYKCNTPSVQMNLLAGLIDSSGYTNNNSYDFIEYNEVIIDDIIFIARSLGFSAFKNTDNATNKYNIGNKIFKTSIHGQDIQQIPVKNIDKQKHITLNTINNATTANLTTPITITKYKDSGNYYGFTIDGNHRFLLGDFQVTHNTAMGLYIASKLKTKTLVVVHKTFLLNQWVERINEFLPKTRIGKIQGQVIDIDNKDIVIAMLQSLSLKEYPQNIFKSFGLTIVDECHHISSEVFSRSLLKLVTKYTLGLSATINRKDGLTNVFKMFLGDIAYSVKRESNSSVMVKGIEFKIDDDEFNETSYDYRGNPAFSTMITKICNFNIRTEFIISVIIKELNDFPEQQMLVLGQNKSILTYLFKAIETRNIASVGYYIGGMKEEQLKQSENKKIIIATYAMASEGLDIKSLSTLLLITPRTDITQAVGRILRMPHERPLIIDFIDTHDIFTRQWKKRLTFYKKNNYTIKTTDNLNYNNDNYNLIKNNSKKNKSNSPKISKCLININ